MLAIPCLRVREDFLAITTMGINFVVEATFLYVPFFGAGMGIGGINLPSLFGREITKQGFLVLVLGVILVFIVLDRWLIRSWIGLAWAAIREDEGAAGAMGIDVVRFKVLAFTLGSTGAGLAGSLYAHFLTFIMPVNFSFGQSIVILSMVVFGGIGTLRGPIVGAVVLGALPEISRPAMEYRTLLYGVLLSSRPTNSAIRATSRFSSERVTFGTFPGWLLARSTDDPVKHLTFKRSSFNVPEGGV